MSADVPHPLPSRLARLSAARACWMKYGAVLQGRAGLRIALDEPAVVTPWNVGKNRPEGASLLATARDLSASGLSFSHADSLPFRYVAVSLSGHGETGEPRVETIVVRLLWCRFLRRGGYMSGGRIERALAESFGRPLASLLCAAEESSAPGEHLAERSLSSSGRAAPAQS